MLEAGEIDAFIGPRTPSCFERGAPNIGWLWPDPMAAAKDYFRKTGNFPIMHMIGVRRTLVTQHPWLPAAVLKAFTRAKSICLALLEETFRQQGDAAVHGRAGAGRARPDGRGLLALWHPGEPQVARVFSRASTTVRACRRGSSMSRSCSTRPRSRRTSCKALARIGAQRRWEEVFPVSPGCHPRLAPSARSAGFIRATVASPAATARECSSPA